MWVLCHWLDLIFFLFPKIIHVWIQKYHKRAQHQTWFFSELSWNRLRLWLLWMEACPPKTWDLIAHPRPGIWISFLEKQYPFIQNWIFPTNNARFQQTQGSAWQPALTGTAVCRYRAFGSSCLKRVFPNAAVFLLLQPWEAADGMFCVYIREVELESD